MISHSICRFRDFIFQAVRCILKAVRPDDKLMQAEVYMIRFNSDYGEGAHPQVLSKLLETNMEQTKVYGDDRYCEEAAAIVKDCCGVPRPTSISWSAGRRRTCPSSRPPASASGCRRRRHRPHQHPRKRRHRSHRHKDLALESPDGKLTAGQIRSVYVSHYEDDVRVHTVQPKLVYISNPTELGTIYTRAELTSSAAPAAKTP
jgi:threonine aldolase